MEATFLVLFMLNFLHTESIAERCLQDLSGSVARKQFKLTINNQIQATPLKIHYGQHASQQIFTSILKILAEDILGYENIKLVGGHVGLMDVEDVLKTLAGCKRCDSLTPLKVPLFMVDTEVWLPLDHQTIDVLDKGYVLDAGLITEHGRYGWYIPTLFVQNQWAANNIIANHWRSLTTDNILNLLKTNLTILSKVQNLTEIRQYCGEKKDCVNGISSLGQCDGLSSFCMVLLADFPGRIDSHTYQLIQGLNLNISVFWLGSKLPQTISKELKNSRKPFVLLNWEPNTLTSIGNLSRIFLPSCSQAAKNLTSGCDYPLFHLKKLVWNRVKTGASDFYHLLEKMYLPREELQLLLREHRDSGGTMNSYDTACHWLRKRRSAWLPWLPSDLQSGKIPVYLGGMFPMKQNNEALWVRPGILTGAEMALRKVNEDPSILSNYTLRMITIETQCQTSLVLSSYIQFVSPHRNYSLAGILGPACSIQAEIIAEVSPFYNTVVMGYSVEGINLANRKKYPLFFRTSPSYFEFKKAYSALFYAFDWKQYAALTDVNYGSTTVTAIHEYLADKGIKLVYSRFIALQESVDIKNYLRSIQKSNARIILAHMFEDVARKVICEASKEGMTPQNGYVWFLPSWLHHQWFLNNASKPSRDKGRAYATLMKCTDQEMIDFIKGGYFSLDNSFFADGNTKVTGGGTVDQWKEAYKENVQEKGYPSSDYASFAYDAVWAYAFAFDKLFKKYPSSLDTIRTNITTHRLKSFLQKSNFSGVSGRVSFKDGERYLPTINIVQYFDSGSPVTVGQFQPVSPGQRICEFHEGCLDLNETLIMWPGNIRPSDGRPDHMGERICAVESFRKLTGLTCDWSIAVINIIAIGLFLIVVIAILWLCIKRRYDNKYKRTRKRMEELGLMYQSPIMQLDDWEIPREDVVLNRKLGEGAFGTVFGGEAKGISGQSEWMPVAVKTLKVGSSLEEKLEFLSEAETMKVFGHKNIVKLLGVCTKGEPAMAIMELMIHGDLKSFLLARRQFVHQSCKEAEDVTPARLTNMALEIASGLAYLSNLKYVHRDLALRNCMVGSGHVVKLGDFGMTRAMFDSDYYRFGRKGMLPVRWMAPESLADGVFTTKSDVWGLGVTIWELCTMGSFPYQGLSNSEVVLFVKGENIMDMPRDCTAQLADLLHRCWRTDLNERPEPIDIIDVLTDNSKIITPCLEAPIASIAADDDLVDTESITADKPGSPRLISRKFSRAFKPSTLLPTSSRELRPMQTRRLSEDQLKTMIDSLTPPGSPSHGDKKERQEEFV